MRITHQNTCGDRWCVIRTLRARTAFTLIELLIALALIGTIVTIVYGSFNATSRSVDLYQSRLACCDRACLVLRLMARQLRCTYLPALGADPTTRRSQDANAPATPSAVPRTDLIESDGATFSFVTTAGMDAGTGTAAALTRVSYRRDPATETLSISCGPYVYGIDSPADAQTWRPILSGVKNLEIQFYDGRQWQANWTGGIDGALLQGIKIALTVEDQKRRTHEFATMVPVGCRSTPMKQQVMTAAGRLE